MSGSAAVAAPVPVPAPAATGGTDALAHYRDDGLLARALCAALGHPLPVPLGGALAGVLCVAVLLPGDPPRGLVLAGVAVAVVLACLDADRDGRLAWLGPPLLRAVEYGVLARLGALSGAGPAAFALLGALAFCHYDTVYRLRHQREAVPSWATGLTLGWDGRLLLAAVAYVAGGFGPAALVAAVLIAVVRVSESVTSWVRFSAATRPTEYVEQEEDEE